MTYTQGNRSAYTIAEFCAEHRVSRTHLYMMVKAGKGPRLMKLGRRVLISVEAAADWRRAVEVHEGVFGGGGGWTAAPTVAAAALRERAQRWLEGELDRAERGNGRRWPEHEPWVREYLAHELRERIAKFQKVSHGSR